MATSISTKRVKIEDGRRIVVDGMHVGTISSGREVYVTVLEDGKNFPTSIARFKYCNPRTKAVTWVKFVFSRLTVPEILSFLKVMTPLELAYYLGYPKPSMPI